MNVEVLMEAINGINEKYIIEASEIKKPFMLKAHLLKVACMLLAISAVLLSWYTLKKDNIIWANELNIEELNEAIKSSKKGTVIITRSLYDATEKSSPTDINEGKKTNKKYFIAILVTETSGASNEDVYEKFVKPLTKSEEYFEKGVIYLTTEELMKVTCPNDLALVLTLAEGD